MKKRILPLLLSAAAIAFICNCGEETTSSQDVKNVPAQAYVVTEPSFVYVEGDKTFIISQTTGTVTDVQGNYIGNADLNAGVIVDVNGAALASGIDITTLKAVNPPTVTSAAWAFAANDQIYIIYTDGNVTDENGNPVGIFVYMTDPTTGTIVIDPATQLPTTVGNIIALDGVTPVFTNVDLGTLKVILPSNDNPIAESSASLNPKSSAATPASSAGIATSSAATPKSSSSVKPTSSANSSSSAKSSSSEASSSSQVAAFQIKYVSGGKSGSGYATRYWDCCKPHCAWPEHGGTASTCDAKGNTISDKSATSMCDGGNAGICRNQFPIAVNDTLAFAFAATPGGENNCGKCFDLVFTGEGKYATDRHKKIKGHHLIVMSNNVGYDVAGGQFDVMIPGGGFGIFDGCSSKMGWGSQGSQYGGLLDECEKETNYYAANYQKCLRTKCEKSFSMDPEAKEGCLFLADWMNAAGNPLLTYKEVECPQELIDRF